MTEAEADKPDPAAEYRNRASACMAEIQAACARHRCTVAAYVTHEPVGADGQPPTRTLATASWVVMPLA